MFKVNSLLAGKTSWTHVNGWCKIINERIAKASEVVVVIVCVCLGAMYNTTEKPQIYTHEIAMYKV